MRSFGMEMSGQFIIERIQSLPDFTPYDEGRLVYVYDEDAYYIGGIVNWVRLTKGGNKIRKADLDLGTSYGQINASIIPVQDLDGEFSDPTSVFTCLRNLAFGEDIKPGAIVKKHIVERAIQDYHLHLGFDVDQISAKTFPCEDRVLNYDLPTISTIQDVINKVVFNTPFIVRQQIQITAWFYNIVDEIYRADISYIPIKNTPMIVQCYDQSMELFSPAKITYDNTTKKVQIYSPYKIFMNVVMIG